MTLHFLNKISNCDSWTKFLSKMLIFKGEVTLCVWRTLNGDRGKRYVKSLALSMRPTKSLLSSNWHWIFTSILIIICQIICWIIFQLKIFSFNIEWGQGAAGCEIRVGLAFGKRVKNFLSVLDLGFFIHFLTFFVDSYQFLVRNGWLSLTNY